MNEKKTPPLLLYTDSSHIEIFTFLFIYLPIRLIYDFQKPINWHVPHPAFGT